MRPTRPVPKLVTILGSCVLALSAGCGGKTPATVASPPPSQAVSAKTPELTSRLSTILNDEEIRYRPLDYQWSEDLLKIVDEVEAYLAGKTKGPVPRAMPRLTEEEELAHFRETIRRWEKKHGKPLRPEIDRLKAEVAARKPGGPAYHPEFQKQFSAVFDDFIPIEVEEIRERRNRVIHEKAKPLLDKFRASSPELVRQQEAFLDRPPYNVPPASQAAK